jgi:hypothetical protein
MPITTTSSKKLGKENAGIEVLSEVALKISQVL